MLKRYLRAGLVAGVFALAGCVGAVPALTSLITSPIGQSLITALVSSYVPGINTAIANVSNKIASSQDAEIAGEALKWGASALSYFGGALGLPQQDVAAANQAIADAQAVLANPPQDLNSAVSQALTAYYQVTALLKPALSSSAMLTHSRVAAR